MADLKISELAAAGALTGSELVELVQGGVNKRTTTQAIADLGGGGGGSITSVNGDTGPVVVLDATDVGADPAGSASTVNTALGNHIADATDAHAGTAITNTPAGNISATNVQAALNELDTEKQPLDADLTAIATLTPSNDDVLQRKAGVWTNRTIPQLATDLGVGNQLQFAVVQSLRNLYNY